MNAHTILGSVMATARPSPVTAGDDDDSLPPASLFLYPEFRVMTMQYQSNYEHAELLGLI